MINVANCGVVKILGPKNQMDCKKGHFLDTEK